MQRLLLSVFLLVLASTLWAQEPPGNLVPNWSFEELEWPDAPFPCPNSPGEIYKAKYWVSAGATSVDYFNACSTEYPDYGAPTNLVGNQLPALGDAYVAIGCYSMSFSDAKEYLMTELRQPLLSNRIYLWKIQVSLCDSVNFAISRIGAYFSSESTQFWDREDFFDVEPQVENPFDSLLSDKENWMTVSGTFPANGDERFMTIGFFRRDAEENVQRVSDFPQGNYTWEESGYYIDNIELYEIGTTGIEETLAQNTLTIFPNPATDHLTIHTSRQPSELRLLDPLGRTLLLNHPTQQETQLNVSTLPKGIYLLQAHFPDGTRTTQRVIIN